MHNFIFSGMPFLLISFFFFSFWKTKKGKNFISFVRFLL